MVRGLRLIEKVTPYAKRISAVSHNYRVAIMYLLSHNEMEVWELTEALGIAENLVSHHLKQMFSAGWVFKTKVGRNVVYRLNENALFELAKLFADTPFFRQIIPKRTK